MSEPTEDDAPYVCPDCYCLGAEPHAPHCPEWEREERALFGDRTDDDEEWDDDEEDFCGEDGLPW